MKPTMNAPNPVSRISRGLAPNASMARSSLPNVKISARSKQVVLLNVMRKTISPPMSSPALQLSLAIEQAMDILAEEIEDETEETPTDAS